MGSTGTQIARKAWSPSRADPLDATLPRRAGVTALSGDDLVVRSLRSAGCGALVGLPLLMLASLVLDVPLAGPALIASGYLGIAFAAGSNWPARASLISAIVF